ncbi:MAG: hypothetical protein JWO15_3567 [Sphingomonadales bacterium]|nr:hypothetical protein [Sphingomonadales bacterium]
MNDNRPGDGLRPADSLVEASLSKLLPIMMEASKRCTEAQRADYFEVENMIAAEIILAVGDGRLNVQDLAFITAYHTLYLAAMQRISADVADAIMASTGGSHEEYGDAILGNLDTSRKPPLN